MFLKPFFVFSFFYSTFGQLNYVNDFWTPNYGIIGYRVILSPFNSAPYGGIIGASKEMTRLSDQMTSLVRNAQSDQRAVIDVISGHNRRMNEISRQMTDLAKSVAEMSSALSTAARSMADLVRDGEERQKIRSREMTTTAVNLAELARRMAAEDKKCPKDEKIE